MKKIEVDLDLVGSFMSWEGKRGFHYLDTQSGRVVTVADLSETIPADATDRYLPIPDIEAPSHFAWMHHFAYMSRTPNLYEDILALLDLEAISREFEEKINRHPDERIMWFFFRQQKLREEAAHWLEEQGFEAVDTSIQGESAEILPFREAKPPQSPRPPDNPPIADDLI